MSSWLLSPAASDRQDPRIEALVGEHVHRGNCVIVVAIINAA